jgi:hypothetical protein
MGFGPTPSFVEKTEFFPTSVAKVYKTVKITLVFSGFHHYSSIYQQNK